MFKFKEFVNEATKPFTVKNGEGKEIQVIKSGIGNDYVFMANGKEVYKSKFSNRSAAEDRAKKFNLDEDLNEIQITWSSTKGAELKTSKGTYVAKSMSHDPYRYSVIKTKDENGKKIAKNSDGYKAWLNVGFQKHVEAKFAEIKKNDESLNEGNINDMKISAEMKSLLQMRNIAMSGSKSPSEAYLKSEKQEFNKELGKVINQLKRKEDDKTSSYDALLPELVRNYEKLLKELNTARKFEHKYQSPSYYKDGR